jgi:hypothetical protein
LGGGAANADGGGAVSPGSGTVKLVRSFVALVHTASEAPAASRLRSLPGWDAAHLVSADGRSELAFTADEKGRDAASPPAPGALTLVVGDDAEWDETRGCSCMAGAACVSWSATGRPLSVLSSVVGLPPIFIYREPGLVAVASELRLLRAISGSRITVDPQAAAQLFRVGYPLDHRTLFSQVTLMPGGHALHVDAEGRGEPTRSWEPPDGRPASGASLLDLQVDAFRRAVRNLRLSDSLFSLTGGLDTRAILAVLAEAGATFPACTLSGGGTLCLDARLAKALCRAYGLPHVVVSLDDGFLRDLPRYVVEASWLSGGLASLEQAHEVYFYEQLAGIGSRRLSGHVGNQVGRQHLERVSLRGADTRALHPAIRTAAAAEPGEHWLVRTAGREGHPLGRSLIQYEVAFSSLANYGIGHRFMIQQSPYANRHVIETALQAPSGRSRAAFRPRRARLAALAHRFVGPRRTVSFQRQVIAATRGAVAELPINWGWRARGGFSATGLGWGLLAFADSALSRMRRSSRLGRKGLHLAGAAGLGEITQYRSWFDTVLREFVHDTLRSRLVTQSALFDAATVARLSDEHYRGVRSHYDTLVATLDLALAQRLGAGTCSSAGAGA